MIADLEAIVTDAGFGSDGAEHRTRIGLTEAEAAAVCASQQQFEKDDIILVCDAGGGTTDVNVLKMMSSKGQATRLQQLSYVEGRSIGSALIDIDFHEIIFRRLQRIQQYLLESPEDVADIMVRDKFESVKCSFGTPVISSLPSIPLEVPCLAPGHHFHPGIFIENSRMIFTHEEVRVLFDSQVDHMIRLIDQQFMRVQENHPVLSCPLRRPWKLALREATIQSTLRIWWLQFFENRFTEHEDRRSRRAPACGSSRVGNGTLAGGQPWNDSLQGTVLPA